MTDGVNAKMRQEGMTETRAEFARLADIDRQLLLAADAWMKTEQRERTVAFNLTHAHEQRHNSGDLYKDSRAGKELREQIRDAERHAQMAQDQALKIRREIVGPRMRGAGKKEPVPEPVRARDPATQALIDDRNRKKAEKEARRKPVEPVPGVPQEFVDHLNDVIDNAAGS